MNDQNGVLTTAAGPTPAPCRHCPECPRQPEHRIGNAWYCSPCLVSFLDWLEYAARPEAPVLQQARRLASTLAPTSAARGEGYAQLGSEGARARHIYGWREQPRRPQPRERGARPPAAAWDTLTEFYAARGGLRSAEADYGARNDGLAHMGRYCPWRVSVVASTGDLYAAAACSCGQHPRILLLGGVEPDPQYSDADERFAGWESEPRGLDWFWSRAAAPQPVRKPLLPLPAGAL